jgi:hypothetical protein
MQASSVKIAWKVILVMGIYGIVISLFDIFPTESTFGSDFLAFTGQSWSDFLASNPKPAEMFIITKRLLGTAMLLISLLVILIAWKSYSKAEKWSWYTLLMAGIIAWGGLITYLIVIGSLASMGLVIFIIGVALFVVGIAIPAKAILGKKSA